MKRKELGGPKQCPPLPDIQDRTLLSPGHAAAMEGIFKVLANATRLRILDAIARAPDISVGELADAVGMKVQAVSNQLRRLVDRGVVAPRRDGNNIRYHVLDACTISLLDQGYCLTLNEDDGQQPRLMERAQLGEPRTAQER